MNHFKDSICLNRYSYNVWKKINPEYGYDEWKSFNVPDSVSEFILKDLRFPEEVKQKFVLIVEQKKQWMLPVGIISNRKKYSN